MSYTVMPSVEYYLAGGAYRPCTILVNSDDDLATVMTEGYLDGDTTLTYTDDLMALVNTSEGLVWLAISTANKHISLIAPLNPSA